MTTTPITMNGRVSFFVLTVLCGDCIVPTAGAPMLYVRETLDEYATPLYAVLFPFFVLLLGVVVFFLLKRFGHLRFVPPVPYAACMFLLGMIMGVGVMLTQTRDQLSLSILQWATIDPDVLLAVFLPGLIFREAIEVNFDLFAVSFWQMMILAYPMVLVQTGLIALVGTYVLPFQGWTLSVSATLGAILSSTDPAAVAAVLKEAGAPPRLKMHIGGESMLNDGSAVSTQHSRRSSCRRPLV